MCPTDKEVEEKILGAAPPDSEVVEDLQKDSVEVEEEVSEVEEVSEEEKEFEGVDRLEDIPKGKEKKYGI